MKFGIFYEHQLPRPWTEKSEYQLMQDSLEQIELADNLGYDFAWEVEHHFLEEYSHSSAPEVFLAAASQRTKNIRLGHGIIQLTTNQPHRVAERVSTLDLVSGGRVEMGKRPREPSCRCLLRQAGNGTASITTFPHATSFLSHSKNLIRPCGWRARMFKLSLTLDSGVWERLGFRLSPRTPQKLGFTNTTTSCCTTQND